MLYLSFAAVATAAPLKVYILAGQSNAVGMAEVHSLNKSSPGGKLPMNGTLSWQLTDPRTATLFAPLWDKATSNWTILPQVSMWYNEVGQLGKAGTMDNGSTIPGINGKDACFGPLTVGYGAACGANDFNNIGPELGFGFGISQTAEKDGTPFLIMKNAWGGKTLCGDFRPPTSTTTNDPYCDGPQCSTVGHYYSVMMSNVEKMMAPGAIGAMFPKLAGLTPVVSGFGWWQGWNDGCNLNCTAAYEQNMVNLIADVRTAWRTPSLPVSIATAGFLSPADSQAEEVSRAPKGCWRDGGIGGKLRCNCAQDRGCRRLDVVLSQIDATNATKHPELDGHAVTVDQRPYHRESQYSPNHGQGYHYWHNAETYYLTGLAMARGMVAATGN